MAPDPLIGKSLGGCVLKDRIGRGGMGTVYHAVRQSDKRAVAVKILSPFMSQDAAVVERFTREARASSRVLHPNVIRMYGAAQEDGLHFTLMDFVDGEDLSNILKREGQLSTGQAVFIACEVAQGLRALHQEGIIHRDVKPANILIGRDGSVRITDFGIARDIFELQRLTAPGDLLGTIGFAAPEQLQQSSVDFRADLYSLGATLHYMLSGVRPPADFKIPLATLDGDVPAEIRDLVARLLSREVAQRPVDAASVVTALAPYSKRPRSFGRTLRDRFVRLTLAVAGGALVLWAGAAAASSHGPEYHPLFWTLVLPVREAIPFSVSLFVAGTAFGFLALIKGREGIGLGLRSLLGFTFLAASLVITYLAGASTAAPTFPDAARSLLSLAPESLFALALTLAALGLSIGMRKPSVPARWIAGGGLTVFALGAAELASSGGSPSQGLEDLRIALSQNGWAWSCLPLAAAGLLLAARHHGRLWRVLLAPLVVFVALGIMYWSSQGRDSRSLQDALAGPAGGTAVALVLAIGARAVLDLRPRSRNTLETATDYSTATPPASP